MILNRISYILECFQQLVDRHYAVFYKMITLYYFNV